MKTFQIFRRPTHQALLCSLSLLLFNLFLINSETPQTQRITLEVSACPLSCCCLVHFLLGLLDLLSSLLLPLLPFFPLFLVQLPPLLLQLPSLLLHLFGLLPSAGILLPLRDQQLVLSIKINCTKLFQNNNKPHYLYLFKGSG